MPVAPGVRLGTYEVIALLGAGGMGEVYRARDTTLDRDVALKVLPAAVATDADPETSRPVRAGDQARVQLGRRGRRAGQTEVDLTTRVATE